MIGIQQRLFDAPVVMVPPPTGDADGLRPYQRSAVESTLRELGRVRSTLGIAHCGAGKTQIGGSLAKAWPSRVLWLAHRDFLVYQARDRLRQMTGEWPAIEKAGQMADGSRLVVGSVQTLRGARLKSWKPDHFGLIIYDEAHHAMAPGGRAILEWLSGAKVFGITATPRRHDKIGAWNCFESEAFRRDIDEGVADGYFVPIVPVARFFDSIDLGKVKSTAGDLNLGELETQIAEVAAPIAKATFEEMEDRPTIIYTPARASAHAVAATLNELRPGSAVSVDMDTPDVERLRILREFGRSIQYIANCAIYTEGLDVPQARGIVIARPTKSEGLYIQMAGRGGRPAPGIGELETREERIAAIAASGKPNFKLLDCTGHAGRHSLVNVANALAGKSVAQAVRDKAVEVLAENKGITLDDAFKLAEEKLEDEEKQRRKEMAEAAAAAIVKSRRKVFDPFRRLGVTIGPLETGIEPAWTAEPATAADISWAIENRCFRKDMTHSVCAALQHQNRVWKASGKASIRQRNFLSRNGLPVDISSVQAGLFYDMMAARGWKGRLSQQQVDIVMRRERVVGEEG